ncbi:unnamed protein product [Pedinophyceae sp. YPF-701]|nr:unnamed protein product [Pedinophyceae sp. YPF-701]
MDTPWAPAAQSRDQGLRTMVPSAGNEARDMRVQRAAAAARQDDASAPGGQRVRADEDASEDETPRFLRDERPGKDCEGPPIALPPSQGPDAAEHPLGVSVSTVRVLAERTGAVSPASSGAGAGPSDGPSTGASSGSCASDEAPAPSAAPDTPSSSDGFVADVLGGAFSESEASEGAPSPQQGRAEPLTPLDLAGCPARLPRARGRNSADASPAGGAVSLRGADAHTDAAGSATQHSCPPSPAGAAAHAESAPPRPGLPPVPGERAHGAAAARWSLEQVSAEGGSRSSARVSPAALNTVASTASVLEAVDGPAVVAAPPQLEIPGHGAGASGGEAREAAASEPDSASSSVLVRALNCLCGPEGGVERDAPRRSQTTVRRTAEIVGTPTPGQRTLWSTQMVTLREDGEVIVQSRGCLSAALNFMCGPRGGLSAQDWVESVIAHEEARIQRHAGRYVNPAWRAIHGNVHVRVRVRPRGVAEAEAAAAAARGAGVSRLTEGQRMTLLRDHVKVFYYAQYEVSDGNVAHTRHGSFAEDCRSMCTRRSSRMINFDTEDLAEDHPGDFGGDLDDQLMCVVCQDYLEDGDTVVRLPCKHMYHWDCFRGYLEHRSTTDHRCPIDNAMLADMIADDDADSAPAPVEAEEPRALPAEVAADVL